MVGPDSSVLSRVSTMEPWKGKLDVMHAYSQKIISVLKHQSSSSGGVRDETVWSKQRVEDSMYYVEDQTHFVWQTLLYLPLSLCPPLQPLFILAHLGACGGFHIIVRIACYQVNSILQWLFSGFLECCRLKRGLPFPPWNHISCPSLHRLVVLPRGTVKNTH